MNEILNYNKNKRKTKELIEFYINFKNYYLLTNNEMTTDISHDIRQTDAMDSSERSAILALLLLGLVSLSGVLSSFGALLEDCSTPRGGTPLGSSFVHLSDLNPRSGPQLAFNFFSTSGIAFVAIALAVSEHPGTCVTAFVLSNTIYLIQQSDSFGQLSVGQFQSCRSCFSKSALICQSLLKQLI